MSNDAIHGNDPATHAGMPGDNPTFTVFTPAYNRARTIERGFQSLQKQTCRSFEWLVIDDGSTDDTREVVARFEREATFPLRYVRQPNGGKAAAWNRALMLARGKYFLCLDSDDGCVPEALATFLQRWEEIPESSRHLYSGVTAATLNDDGLPFSPSLPHYPFDGNSIEVKYRFRVDHDGWDMFVTDVLRSCPFELIEGYTGYIPEGTIFNKLATRWMRRYVPDRLLRVYSADHGAEVTGHQSAPVKGACKLRFARGVRVAHRSLLKYHCRWAVRAPIRFYRAAANYCRFSFREGIGFGHQLKEVGPSRLPALLVALAAPIGYLWNLRDRLQRV